MIGCADDEARNQKPEGIPNDEFRRRFPFYFRPLFIFGIRHSFGFLVSDFVIS
jgi:hypothetical protein